VKTLRVYWLAARLILLFGWVKVRLALQIKTSKGLWRRWYDLLSSLTQLVLGELRFMNYGYVAPGDKLPVPLSEEERADEYQARMYQLVATGAGRIDPRGKRILEVGCGRGGGAAWMARHLGAEQVVGVDLSEQNIASARQAFVLPGLSFQPGDAEALPFPEGSFDLVVNVESSHCYPDYPAFLREVRRVLRPGGVLSTSDFRQQDRLLSWEEEVRSGPLFVLEREDITVDVVRALEADHDRKVKAIADSGVPSALRPVLQQFTGCRGGDIFDSFVQRRRVYLRFLMRRDAGAP
jgi:SAM-dependent methyltransferase